MRDNEPGRRIFPDGVPAHNDGGCSTRVGLWLAGVGALAIGALAMFGSFGESAPAPNSLTLPPTTTTVSITTTTTTPTTTTLSVDALAALEYEADVELIDQLWWDQSTAWADGFQSGVQFWVDNNYPDMGCTFDDYLASWFPDGPIEGLQIERIVNRPTIELDEGWIIPGGKLKGVPAKGRVYIMSVSDSFTAPDRDPVPPSISSFHATILDGRAHFFVGCPV